MVPHADNNVYLSMPHPAGDPVMAANRDRVLEEPHHLCLTARLPCGASSLQYA